MNHEHHPWQKKGVAGGANADVDRTLHDSLGNNYEDAENLYPAVSGESGILKRVPGEAVEHPVPPLGGAGYVCIGAIEVAGKKVTFWAHPDQANFPSYIQVDGDVMVKSPNLPYLVEWPLQIDKNEDCAGAEFFPVDYNSIPMVFNLGDIVSNFNDGTNKYFSEFTTQPYEINRNAPLDTMVFTGFTNVGAGGGQPVGKVRYGLRYVTDQGDRTNVTKYTPWIDVPKHLGSPNSAFTAKSVGHRGGAPDPQLRTPYAPTLIFRINNEFDYDAIEIVREELNDDQGSTGEPSVYMVYRIDIGPGEFRKETFIDTVPTESATQLSADELARGLFFIKRAKAIKYHDSRINLGNVEIESPGSFSMDFLEFSNNEKLAPITQDIGRVGYRDPVNNAYFKRLRAGEKYGWAIQPYNQIFGKGWAIPIPGYESYQMPNRRNEKDGPSAEWSSLPLDAANSANVVTPTFEAVNTLQGDMLQRTPGNSIRTITAPDIQFLSPPPGTPATITPSFNPMTPTDQDDQDTSGLDMSPTRGAYRQGNIQLVFPASWRPTGASGQWADYLPKVHAPKVQSLGVAIAGVENLSDNVKAFSVVRTKKAGRVVCQGLGFWHLVEDTSSTTSTSVNMASRLPNRLWFQSPDIESGMVPEEVIQDILDNPSQYKIQLVSPLGMTAETFSGYGTQGLGAPDEESINTRGVDMLCYARVFKDGFDVNEIGGMLTGGYSGGHVGYSRWRSTSTPATDPFQGNGDVLFDLTAASFVTNTHLRGGGRYNLLVSPPTGQLYGFNTPTNQLCADINSTSTRAFHEPVYVINIIKEGAEVEDSGSVLYEDTGYYQKLRSVIGYSPGQQQQTHDLVDERPDDITAFDWDANRADRRRYIWVERPGGDFVRYLDIRWLPGSVLTQVALDISNFGFHVDTRGNQVYGIYQASQLQDGTWQIQIPPSYAPVEGMAIEVRYDSDAPMRVFGGDSIVAEFPHVYLDTQFARNAGGDQIDNGFYLEGMPMPFTYFNKNNRYVTARDGTSGNILNRIEQYRSHRIKTLRQLVVMADIETESPHHLYVEGDGYFAGSYPGTNYVMRPTVFWGSETTVGASAGVSSAYPTAYEHLGDQVSLISSWSYGGFLYTRNLNYDYTYRGLGDFIKPPEGTTFKTLLCHSIIASLQKNHRATNSPSLRTFPDDDGLVQNLDDAFGEIKILDAMRSGQGENLYAITNDGVAIVYTSKSPLYGADGNTIGFQALDNYFNTYQWISRGIGCPDEFWRAAVRGLVPSEGSYVDAWIIPYRRGVSMLTASGMRNISRNFYDSKLVPWLKQANADMSDPMSGVYDSYNNKYMMSIGYNDPNDPLPAGDPRIPRKVFVYSPQIGWVGTHTYQFDRYLCTGLGDVYGMRDGTVFLLTNDSDLIGGQPIASRVDIPFGPNTGARKEFCRIRVHSVAKPAQVVFYDRNDTQLAAMTQALFGPLYLMQMDGWEHHVPSLANGWRMQDDVVMARVVWSNGDDPILTDVQMQIKNLK